MERIDITPCLIDERRDCSNSCPLYNQAKTVLEGFSQAYGLDTAVAVYGLREALKRYSPGIIDGIIRKAVTRLEEMQIAYRCQRYVQIKIR